MMGQQGHRQLLGFGGSEPAVRPDRFSFCGERKNMETICLYP